MASRRAQIRQLFSGLSPEYLTGTTIDALCARTEANLAAVEVWSNQGNQHVVRKAGTGLLAISACHALCTLSTSRNIRLDSFHRASGLTPKQFLESHKDLRSAFAARSTPASTPQKCRIHDDGGQTCSPAASGAEKLARWADQMKSGMSPSKSSLGPSTPTSNRLATDDRPFVTPRSGQALITPTRSGLRDRSSIKGKEVYDPSPEITPAKRKRSSTTTRPVASSARLLRSGSPDKSINSIAQANDGHSARSKNVKPSKRPGPVRGYPVSLGFSLEVSEDDLGPSWSAQKARDRVQYILTLLDQCDRHDAWEDTRSGHVEQILLR